MALLKIEEPSEINSEEKEEFPIIGIDLGTTNSLVGVVVNGETRFFKDEAGREIHKSVVAFDENGEFAAAGNKADLEDFPFKIYSIKRLMGKGFEDLKKDEINFEIERDENTESSNFKILIGKKKYLPEEISGFILNYLKELAFNGLGIKNNENSSFSSKLIGSDEEKIKAVITVPAYFDEGAKNATKFAALMAKIEVIRLVNEPTAAALAYGLDSCKQGIYGVFDLGGGTFDMSVLKMKNGVFKVLGVSGNNNLGGDDFDFSVKQILNEKLKEFNAYDLKEIIFKDKSKKSDLVFCKIAKKIKEELSQKNKVILSDIFGKNRDLTKNLENNSSKKSANFKEFDISENINEKTNKILAKIKITRDELEKRIAPKINETINLTKNLLKDLEIEIGEEKSDVRGLILVGGSSRIPLIQEKLKDIFGANIKIFTDLNPDMVVGQGAVLQAFNLGGKGDNLLLDVLPLSLGVEMMGGIVDKVIQRNTTIPAAYGKEFTTYADNQTGMKFKIVQGEREFAKDCRELAEFEVKKIPPLRAGLARILVTFKVDADGLLTVTSEEKITGERQEIEVKPSFGLDENKVKTMLVESLQNSKTDIFERLLVESKREARQNIDFVKRDLKEYSFMVKQSEKKLIEEKVKKLEKVLDDENSTKETIVNMQKELEKASAGFVLKKMDASLKEYVGKGVDEV